MQLLRIDGVEAVEPAGSGDGVSGTPKLQYRSPMSICSTSTGSSSKKAIKTDFFSENKPKVKTRADFSPDGCADGVAGAADPKKF